jgi:hypothetical protein
MLHTNSPAAALTRHNGARAVPARPEAREMKLPRKHFHFA